MFSHGNAAWAKVEYAQIYTVGAQGNDEAKSVFGLGEKPWLYLQLPNGTHQYNTDTTFSEWNLGGDSFYPSLLEDSYYREGNNIWIAFSDANWSVNKAVGEWEIDALTVLYKDGKPKKSVLGMTNFTVTPEPVSVCLFLLGAGGMFVRRLRKEKSA